MKVVIFFFQCHCFLFAVGQWCSRTCFTTEPITGSSPHLAMNDLIGHQQVVTEAPRGEERSVWFPHSCREEGRGMHQLQTMALYPCQWRATHSTTHTYTHKHSHTHPHTHTHTNTNIQTLELLYFHSLHGQQKTLSERVATLFVCAHKLLKQNMIMHTPSSVVLAVALRVCV